MNDKPPTSLASNPKNLAKLIAYFSRPGTCGDQCGCEAGAPCAIVVALTHLQRLRESAPSNVMPHTDSCRLKYGAEYCTCGSDRIEIERLRAALEGARSELQVEEVDPDDSRESVLAILNGALNGNSPSPSETAGEPEWRAMREHELRYIESVLVTIRGQYGEPATETASEALARLRNRLTVQASETPGGPATEAYSGKPDRSRVRVPPGPGEVLTSPDLMSEPRPIPVREIIGALEREGFKDDIEGRWLLTQGLRRLKDWQTRTLMCRIDQRPSEIVGAQIHPREEDNRDVSAERCRNAAAVPETSGSYSRSDPSEDARTPAGAGIASPALSGEPPSSEKASEHIHKFDIGDDGVERCTGCPAIRHFPPNGNGKS